MNPPTHRGTKPDRTTSAGGELTPVVLVIRDPDYENTFVVDGEVETIGIDLGRAFDGPNGFRALSDEEQRKWIESTIAEVAHLPAGSAVRKAVEELVEEIAS